MDNIQIDEALDELEACANSVTKNLRLTPSALREAIQAVRRITRLSFIITREVIARIRALEAK